jgi:hypothetical protein
MKKKDAIIAAQNELREKTNYLNGFAFIWEPLNGDENGWVYKAFPLSACYAAVRGRDSQFAYENMPAGVTKETHRMRYFIDFFNRYSGKHVEDCGAAWRYIIQKSIFKPIFEKDTFKNQLRNGVIFDMTKWRWRAIICACISMRFMHEYKKGVVFNILKKNGLTEKQAFYSSWFLGEHGGRISFPHSNGHGLIDTMTFSVESFMHFLGGKGIVLAGNSTVGERDAISSAELNVDKTVHYMRSKFLTCPGIVGKEDIWGGGTKTAPTKNIVSFIKQLDKK